MFVVLCSRSCPLYVVFRWLWRQRIRLHLEGTGINPTPVDLHEQQLSLEQHNQAHRITTMGIQQRMSLPVMPVCFHPPVWLTVKYAYYVNQDQMVKNMITVYVDVLWCSNAVLSDFLERGRVHESFSKPSLLPVRSLNEIFIGESLSSR